ncbi:MAG TPA: sensor histidine kinase [Chromatiales bacterium]|nr:sensor histidine kinase [Chromatiales bacterium]
MMRIPMQLRHKFFLVLALLSSVPLLILLFGVVEQMKQEITARTEAEMLGTLDKMAGEVSLILDNQKAIARGLAKVPAIQRFASIANQQGDSGGAPGPYPEYAEQLEQFFLNYQYSVPSIQALRFIDRNGKTLIKVKEGKPVEARLSDDERGRMFVADQSNRSFFTQALGEGTQIVMSDFELGQVSQEADFCPAMVRYSVPLRDEVDRVEGVLVVNMWGKQLDSTIEAAIGGHDADAYIVELDGGGPRDGIYLYHPDTAKRFANQLGSDFRLKNELTPAEWQQIREAGESGSLFRDDGAMLFFRKLAPYADRATRWLLVLKTNSETVYAPIIKMRYSIWTLLAVLLFVSLLIAILASRRLTRPVEKLAGIIRRYADGDRSARYEDENNRADEINQAGKAFNYLARRLEDIEKEREQAVRAACQSERLAAIGQLAAGIGHEINNPMMNIMSLASLIENSLDERDEEIRNDIRLLKKEGSRCARIVQGILSFAREKEPSYEEFDMAQLIRETIDLLRHRIDSARIRLTTRIEDSLLMEGDANLLQQVLVNILLNAIQASPPGSEISVRARQNQGQVEIELLDNGVGIAQGNMSKIFDPFFTTKEEGEGTGLGLSISYGIIQRHEGSLWIENLPQGGVRVHIQLPVKSSHANNMIEMRDVENVG